MSSMSSESNANPAADAEKAAVLKANGSAAAAADSNAFELTNATSIFDFVNNGNPWFIVLSDTAQGTESLFQTGTNFFVVATSDTTARIEFPNNPTSSLEATFDPATGILHYKETLQTQGQITFYRGQNPSGSALSGVSLKGDPEPVAIWAADENGG